MDAYPPCDAMALSTPARYHNDFHSMMGKPPSSSQSTNDSTLYEHSIPDSGASKNRISSQSSSTTLTLTPTGTHSVINQPVYKTYTFRRRALHTDLSILDGGDHGNEQPIYYAHSQSCKPKTPDVTLHEGSDKTGRVVGVSHFRYSLSTMQLGIGDPVNDPSGVVWQEMRRPSRLSLKCRYAFEFVDSSPALADGGARLDVEKRAAAAVGAATYGGPVKRRFTWQRTSSTADGIESTAKKLSLRNYRLSDDDTGEVVAVFIAACLSLTNVGELRIYQRLSADLDRIVVLSCASICVKLDRD